MFRSWCVSIALSVGLILSSAGAWADGGAVVFTANDYGFSGPDRIPAGITTMQVVNNGQDLHHVQLLRLPQGKTAEDFRAALSAGSAGLPSWVSYVGGPNAIVPGEASVATMQLAEGEYLLICLIPDKRGIPHVALGMSKALSVKGASPVSMAMPRTDTTITLKDFQFGLSRPIAAGTHTIRVMNHGTQTHEVVVVKLAPGASVKDFAAAFEPGASGPPPGKPIGGVVGLDIGGDALFTATFEPGRYGLICFFPDPVTKAEHFTKGMSLDFTVR